MATYAHMARCFSHIKIEWQIQPTRILPKKVENKEAVTNFRFLENQQDFNRQLIDADISKDQESHSFHPVTGVTEKFCL